MANGLPSGQQFFRERELRELFLGVTRGELRWAMRSRRLRYFRFRREILIRFKDFLAWANARNRED